MRTTWLIWPPLGAIVTSILSLLKMMGLTESFATLACAKRPVLSSTVAAATCLAAALAVVFFCSTSSVASLVCACSAVLLRDDQ